MDVARLLAQPHLSFITRHSDSELARIQDVIDHKVLVEGRGEVDEQLSRLLAHDGEPAPKTLDLIGHSTPNQSLLVLGDWVIDATSSTVTAFFRELAELEVLERLNIQSVRLLGCQTADTPLGRATLCTLADILGVEVHGTRELIYSAHYDGQGFRDDCGHALVCASDVRHDSADPRGRFVGEPYVRVLDIDALPAAPLVVRDHPWPRRIASLRAAGAILRLVRRTEGAQMPGLLSTPSCEIALPAARPGWYHLAQILLEGEFVRVYPDGDRRPGIVFPVDDPPALRALVETLPIAD